MKSLTIQNISLWLILTLLLLKPGEPLYAQCSSTLNSTTYNTVLSGTGNNSWGFTIPQFAPSIGTLVSVEIKLLESVDYSYQLQNGDNTTESYSVNLNRTDLISGSFLTSPISSSYSQTYGPYSLGPSTGIPGPGADYIAQGPIRFINNRLIQDSITGSVANFLGNGIILFFYSPTTTVNATGGTDYTLSGSANDTMHFSVTYYYCNTNTLAEDLTSFTASLQNNSFVNLQWQTQNEVSGKTYEIQESPDGKNFTNVGSESSLVGINDIGNYSFRYAVAGNSTGILYFRLLEIDNEGSQKYSQVRSVNLDEAGNNSLVVYPNPATSFVNLAFGYMSSRWEVNIYAANGALVERDYFFNSRSAYIAFKQRLAAGIYFIRATDAQSQKTFVSNFAVQ